MTERAAAEPQCSIFSLAGVAAAGDAHDKPHATGDADAGVKADWKAEAVADITNVDE